MTIIEAIKAVLQKVEKPLSVHDIYKEIIRNNLYSFSAKNPVGVVAGQIRRHYYGIDFPTANPVKHFKLVGVNLYYIKSGSEQQETIPTRSDESDRLPEEIIYSAHKQHIISLQQDLLDTVLRADPAFFEQLVVDLLLKMGYGENGVGQRTGRSGDGGIDGEILQDSLGLDRIYIQAKRYAETTVGVTTLQQFVGALKSITKGVFITTSIFTKSAIKYAADQQQKSLVLIDGAKLTNLMIQYGIGVQEVKSYKTYKVDQNYFSDATI